ncbi:MAG: N-acetylmuramoyl-L-alanine amidase [Clostridiales bacterium]|nr:N-acetylmuramoyl-L-alanine amidase [Clostridiales bacterium]
MPVNKKVITIDAGHGEWDPGKQNRNTDEKDLNLAVAEKLQVLLETGGAVVFVTRADDKALSDKKRSDLSARAYLANAAVSDIFVSVHHNSYESPSAYGAQVFYFDSSERSAILGQAIQNRLNEFLPGQHKRDAKANDKYYVLKKTAMPAVIVECGFMSNPRELEMLKDESYQDMLAWAIYMGVCDYFISKE